MTASSTSAAIERPLESQPETAAVAVPQSGSRVLQLDVLRGVAILLVLGMHSPSDYRGESGILRPADVFLHQFGWSGVDLFFVLSGFLIGGLLFTEIKKRGRLDVGRFLVRRMLRIWPPYYILLVVVIVRLALEPGGSIAAAWRQTWPAFVHIQNFIETPRSQLWSLAIEEHFYLMLPLFLWLITRNRKNPTLREVPWACALLSVVCLAIRSYFQLVQGFEVRAPMDALFFGVNLAYLHAYRPALLVALAKRWPLLLPVALLLFVPAFFAGKVRLTIGLSCVYLGYALILVCFVYAPPGRWMLWRLTRLVAYVGTHSYSIYLWHRDTTWTAYQLTLELGRKLGLPSALTWALHTLAYMTAAVLGGIVLGLIIETPVQRIRERLFPSRIASASALTR